MSYDKETAGKPLEGSEFDECILNEREQRHILVDDYHGMPGDEYIELRDAYIEAVKKIARQQQWINDLQSGMYVNCVYCGHRYGPADEVPASMADVLKQHIEQCPEHPMSKLKAELELYREKEKHGVWFDAVEAAKIAIATEHLVKLQHQIENGELVRAVRCRECKYSDPLYNPNSNKQSGCVCSFDGNCMRLDDYCSGGEIAAGAKEPQHE
jgi:hypothetical protein